VYKLEECVVDIIVNSGW